jgi:hypothetical protein
LRKASKESALEGKHNLKIELRILNPNSPNTIYRLAVTFKVEFEPWYSQLTALEFRGKKKNKKNKTKGIKGWCRPLNVTMPHPRHIPLGHNFCYLVTVHRASQRTPHPVLRAKWHRVGIQKIKCLMLG